MEDILIIDSKMGTGKTSYIINKIKASTTDRFIYVTPFKTECERMAENVPEKNFVEISKQKGLKLEALKKYLVEGRNIATTHSLFKRFDSEVLELLSANNYSLVIDEENTVIEQVKISPKDLQMLFDTEKIRVNSRNQVEWIDNEYTGKFKELKETCAMENVYFYNGSLLLWLFPVNIFKAMKSVTILTYRFSGSYERAYFDLNSVSYVYKSVRKIGGEFTLVDYIEKDNVEELKDLINIYEGDYNSIGKKSTALSFSQFEKWRKSSSQPQKILQKNLYNYFRNLHNVSSDRILWTCPVDSKDKLKGKGYTKGFLASNSKATNLYRERDTLAYCCNIFVQPQIKQFFRDYGIEINEEEFALASMLQWVWRSAIREGKSINIYIPSSRMRELLQEYLNGER
ncbi:DEAD/DEAH box helicase family protein [Clostridium tyrobutyricum]|uniref:DEAD/DEAH box helicase family protein n=1 Tax=Clostridium tyrobutyricum TaxID=1519 RepID=UPI0010AAB810|nr:DEAD/DEAH box helicase family protein [Clostridium tyrobutyricum]QCH27168.1 hypothetical protein EZN00_00762 [Clostridium tyrobutyricum]